MAGSQLKRLKASLREQGVIGPQQSKRQKKKNAQDGQAKNERRLQKTAALENIREQFNPFQFHMNARGPKFQVTSNKPQSADAARGIRGRPGLLASRNEQRRRETLLVEQQRRNKVGGILDRRFGESDPTMTPEEKALERFAREKQRAHKKTSLFDLEEDEPGMGLTHMGQSLAFDKDSALRDDFDERDLPSDGSDFEHVDRKRLRHMRGESLSDEAIEDESELPERKKSRQDIYREVIAKSKFYKHERMVARDEDDDLRMEIDQELPQLQAMLFSQKPPQEAAHEGNEATQPLYIAGVNKDAFEKEYDVRVRQMTQDRRAQPAERVKTAEELAEEQVSRLKDLEERRLKRMLGQEESDESEDDGPVDAAADGDGLEDEDLDEFGLGQGIKVKMRPTATELGLDDEDDFIIEDDLVATGTDTESEMDNSSVDVASDSANEEEDEDGDDEFTKGLLTEEERKNPLFSNTGGTQPTWRDTDDGIPFTFPCPQSHAEFLAVTQDMAVSKHPLVIQRIRALYHPKLDSNNKTKLANFATVLVQHLAFLGKKSDKAAYPTIESIIRHLHSLAKMFAIDVSQAVRAHLKDMEISRPLGLDNGDLVILTAIGSSLFPASDHFHQVVTPALLCMARYLGQQVPKQLSDYAVGAYISILVLQYQQLSKRYCPEVLDFMLNTIYALSPEECREKLGSFPVHEPVAGTRIIDGRDVAVRRLDCNDCNPLDPVHAERRDSVKVALINGAVMTLAAAAQLWNGKPAFFETFQPALKVLNHLKSRPCRSRLPSALNREIERVSDSIERMLRVAHLGRRPLELHHHRPRAIRTFVPKFEDSFDPYKHYDPNRERAESAKLKAEYRKERKGALRELRKDARFMARESLKQKKAKDAAYEKKYKRLVAEIQGEEGRQANAYEREKQARKRARNR